jgi:hypothetical protein
VTNRSADGSGISPKRDSAAKKLHLIGVLFLAEAGLMFVEMRHLLRPDPDENLPGRVKTVRPLELA